MERRYGSLRVVAGLVWLVGALVLLAAIVGAFAAGAVWGTAASILVAVSGVLSAVFVVAGAESIKVVIDIEENTRHLRHLRDGK